MEVAQSLKMAPPKQASYKTLHNLHVWLGVVGVSGGSRRCATLTRFTPVRGGTFDSIESEIDIIG